MTFEKVALSKNLPNIIVAYTDKHRYTAFENDLPWKRSLQGDMRFINKLIRTEPNTALIVGRRTYETLPKYKNIKVVVVSSSAVEHEGVSCFKKMGEAVEYCKAKNMFIVVFGGVGIYEEAMRGNYRIFCTVVKEGELKGDRIFPEAKVPLINISVQVQDFLVENGVEKTWEFKESERRFEENGFSYKFYFGETQGASK